MTLVTLVYGGNRMAREHRIAAVVNADLTSAAILEGMPDGQDVLNELATHSQLKIVRVAPSCPCCTGNLTMRVTLNRLLRQKPAALYLSLADATHIANVKKFLQDEQYLALLELGPELNCS